MSNSYKSRAAYDHVRPIMLTQQKKQWLLRNYIREITPSATRTAEKPNPWPVALIVIIAVLVMGHFYLIG